MTYQIIQNLRSVWTRKKEYNKLMSLLDYPESRSVALETLVHQTMRSGDESLQIEAIAALVTQVDLPRAILDKITALVYRESNLEVRIAAIELLSWYNSHVHIAFHILKDMLHEGLSYDDHYMLLWLYKKMKTQYFSAQRELALS
mgnify:FL=1